MTDVISRNFSSTSFQWFPIGKEEAWRIIDEVKNDVIMAKSVWLY